jgi:hypothetical protein
VGTGFPKKIMLKQDSLRAAPRSCLVVIVSITDNLVRDFTLESVPVAVAQAAVNQRREQDESPDEINDFHGGLLGDPDQAYSLIGMILLFSLKAQYLMMALFARNILLRWPRRIMLSIVLVRKTAALPPSPKSPVFCR